MNAGAAAAVLSSAGADSTHPVADHLARGSDPNLVAPGMAAFLAFLALALVVIVLGWSMTRQVRRSEYRNAQRRTAAAEQGAGPAGADAARGADTGGADTGGADAGGADADADRGTDTADPGSVDSGTVTDGGAEARP